MDKQALHQKLQSLQQKEADYQKQLVDPVGELIVAGEALRRIHAQKPFDADAAQAITTNMTFLRRVVHDLTSALTEVKRQIRVIRVVEAALHDSQPEFSFSHGTLDVKPENDQKITS